jgi:acyl-CoA dehydrogenase
MVSFQPSEEQQLIRETVAAFARDEVRPRAHAVDESGQVPEAIVQKGWELGIAQSVIPEAYGGAGDARSAISSALIAEELAYGDLSVALHLLSPRLLIHPVVDMGTPAQQEDVLRGFAGDGFVAGTAAVVEPRYDFDLAALATTATRSNGAYVLNGSKCFVPLADQATHILVYARTEEREGYDAADGFLVPRAAPGLAVLAREKNMGIKGLATYELRLENCRVPAAQRLGGEAGCDVARLANLSRVALSALAVGVARAAFEHARDYAKDRRAFGVAIGQKQAIAFMLAEMAIEIDAARLLTWEAAWKLDRGEDATREAYLAKNYAAAMALKVADNALQVFGGHGYIRENLVEMWVRNARGFAMLDGLAIA